MIRIRELSLNHIIDLSVNKKICKRIVPSHLRKQIRIASVCYYSLNIKWNGVKRTRALIKSIIIKKSKRYHKGDVVQMVIV